MGIRRYLELRKVRPATPLEASNLRVAKREALLSGKTNALTPEQRKEYYKKKLSAAGKYTRDTRVQLRTVSSRRGRNPGKYF